MSRGFSWLGISLITSVLGLLCAFPACAQSPAEREVLTNPGHLAGDQFLYDLACQRSSLCIVLWEFGVFSPDDVFQGVRLGATTLAPAGVIRTERVYAEDPFGVRPLAAATGRRFAVFWNKTVPEGPNGLRSQPVYQWFGPDLEQLSDLIFLAEPAESLRGMNQVARIPGGFVELWTGDDNPLPDSSEGSFLSFSGEAGQELRAPVRVNADVAGQQSAESGGLAVDLAAGVITVVYGQFFREVEPVDSDVFFRRFSLAGEPLTPDLRMNSHLTESQTRPVLTTASNGGFVAVWMSREQDGSYDGIFGRRFGGDGSPLGPEFQANQVTLSDQRYPKIARDATGNFVVVWQSYDPSSFGLFAWDIKARLYRAGGRPVGPEIFVNQMRELEQESPLVAFSSNGTFIVAWHSNRYQPPPAVDTGHDIVTRRFSASPADEPCLVGGGKFRCDTGRTGGETEVEHSFGGAGSGPGLLGDIDGDGREDPCVYTGGTFRCDTDHEGGAAEVRIAFAMTGAVVPLLGDMDGDGRADPCLASPGSFSCDTRHDGGAAELRIRFGQSGETLLLGDLDGDHRAEACAFSGGLFRCDTGHDGGKAEFLIRFGQRGDQPLLGDYDGDGRDDPCVFSQGTLLCDTAHDGGAAEAMLSLGRSGDSVVLGNLDGL